MAFSKRTLWGLAGCYGQLEAVQIKQMSSAQSSPIVINPDLQGDFIKA